MKTWEIDVELRVRKTLTFSGPATADAARSIAELALSGQMAMLPLVKWEPDSYGYGRHPVETIIDNGPVIVAVREVPE
jgi:hypothetical protein